MDPSLVCPICSGPAAPAFRVGDRNREITPEQFDYARCRSCGTIFQPAPPAGIGRYYANGYYGFGQDGQPNWTREPTRLASAQWRVSQLLRLAEPGPLVEIGAGTGAFSVAARQAGYEVTAIEMDERCCRWLGSQQVTAICSDQPVAELDRLGPAAAIAMWHVLEHLPDPLAVLQAAAQKLQPGGVLALGVPNTDALQLRPLGSRWPHLDAPRHLCLASPRGLRGACAGFGLRPVLQTTGDPEGRDFDRLGWVYGLSRRPARNAHGPGAHAGDLLWRLLGPVEARGLRGSSFTAYFRKD